MNVVQTLKSERDKLQKDLNRLNAAIKALGGGSASTGPSTNGKRPKLSAAGRARIAAAQRARWAKLRGQGGKSAQKPKVVSMPAKRKTMSPAARKKIAAAQKARWAKVKAAQKKSA
jgi:hypothetical protein